MHRLWSPWRSEYIAAGSNPDSGPSGCVFCSIQRDPGNDEKNFILHRAEHCFVVLNIHPYISGHLLIVPYEHIGDLDAAAKQTTDELMDMTKRSEEALRAAYNPPGFNIGMNLGAAAGAGIVGHIHIHVLPRWIGDSNFMSTLAETRVLPEDLATTFQKLRHRF